MNLASLAPSKAHDNRFMDWLASYFRSGASPSAALVLTKTNTEVDIIGILDSIKVPTLLMQRTHDIDVKIEEGRFISKRISGSKFVEFDGYDHLFWVGNTREVLDEMIAFISNVEPPKRYEKRLITIASISLDQSTIRSDGFNSGLTGENLIRLLVDRYRGKLIKHRTNHFLATFEGPSKGVHCCIDLQDAFRSREEKLAIGIHIGECLVNSNQELRGGVLDIVEKMWACLVREEIIITQTVKNLLSGVGLNFQPSGSIYNPLSGEHLALLLVHDRFVAEKESSHIEFPGHRRNDLFLENVLHSIERRLADEYFGVEDLCKDIGISKRHLQRKLKLIANKSPNQMIRSVRLHRAKELIISKRSNIAEAAFQTGFSNPSYFSKCFKRRV